MSKPKYYSVDGYGVNKKETLIYEDKTTGHTIVGEGLEVNPNGDVTVGKDLYVEDEIVIDDSTKIVNTDGDFVFDDLVWTNDDATTTFTNKTINLDLSGVISVVIEFKLYTSLTRYVTVKAYGNKENTVNANWANYLARREFTVTSSGIVFDKASLKSVLDNNDFSIDNNALIPNKIFVNR